jgi:hypothetical protein
VPSAKMTNGGGKYQLGISSNGVFYGIWTVSGLGGPPDEVWSAGEAEWRVALSRLQTLDPSAVQFAKPVTNFWFSDGSVVDPSSSTLKSTTPLSNRRSHHSVAALTMFVLGVIFAVIGALLMFQHPTASYLYQGGNTVESSVTCISPWNRITHHFGAFPNLNLVPNYQRLNDLRIQSACSSAINGRETGAWILLVLAVVLFVGSLIAALRKDDAVYRR